MPGSDSNEKRSCDPQVKALCHKAMALGHTKCGKDRSASLFPGVEINTFLKLLGVVTNNREGITIQATGVEYHKEYQVCATLKARIEVAVASQATRKRMS